MIGYGPHNDGTSLNKANQRVYHEELCSDRYSIEDASTDNAKLIKTELPNGFDDTLICSGRQSFTKMSFLLLIAIKLHFMIYFLFLMTLKICHDKKISLNNLMCLIVVRVLV